MSDGIDNLVDAYDYFLGRQAFACGEHPGQLLLERQPPGFFNKLPRMSFVLVVVNPRFSRKAQIWDAVEQLIGAAARHASQPTVGVGGVVTLCSKVAVAARTAPDTVSKL